MKQIVLLLIFLFVITMTGCVTTLDHTTLTTKTVTTIDSQATTQSTTQSLEWIALQNDIAAFDDMIQPIISINILCVSPKRS